MIERLQKFMATCGVASRRKCERLIEEGMVKVNGITITELGFKVDSNKDLVMVSDKIIHEEERKVYIAINKPKGCLTASSDDRGRKTVIDLLSFPERVFPVGRLDFETSGLLIITNDGEIFNKIMHPREKIDKTYIAKVTGIPSEEEILKLESGVDIGGYITAPAKVKLLGIEGKTSNLKITIHEGKKRQVRKMCKYTGHPVIDLKRVSIGEIKLGELKEGQWRYLTSKELNYLMNL